MLGRVTKYRVQNDAPSEVFEAASEQERKVRRCPAAISVRRCHAMPPMAFAVEDIAGKVVLAVAARTSFVLLKLSYGFCTVDLMLQAVPRAGSAPTAAV